MATNGVDFVFYVGTRPQLIKLKALVSAADRGGLSYSVYDTNQHYDYDMQKSFYEELELPNPVSSFGQCRHLVVIGDTDSTVDGALFGFRNGISVAHVEAGTRCGRRIREETNRMIADTIATWNFCVTPAQAQNCPDGTTIVTGDVLHDMFSIYGHAWTGKGGFALFTSHRRENTDGSCRTLELLNGVSKKHPIVLYPVHPRIRGIDVPDNVIKMSPLSYKKTLLLLSLAEHIYTDSSGLQREAHWSGAPCTLLRDETEWPEIPIGDGHAADRIIQFLKEHL